MEKRDLIFMPHPGHFICSSDCRFFLNTYTNGYIISTVGEYWPNRVSREIHAEIFNKEWFENNKHLKGDDFDNAYMRKFGYQEIGLERKYETMVFKGKKSSHECCPYEVSDHGEVDFDGYNDAGTAYKGHMRMCEKYSNL